MLLSSPLRGSQKGEKGTAGWWPQATSPQSLSHSSRRRRQENMHSA